VELDLHADTVLRFPVQVEHAVQRQQGKKNLIGSAFLGNQSLQCEVVGGQVTRAPKRKCAESGEAAGVKRSDRGMGCKSELAVVAATVYQGTLA